MLACRYRPQLLAACNFLQYLQSCWYYGDLYRTRCTGAQLPFVLWCLSFGLTQPLSHPFGMKKPTCDITQLSRSLWHSCNAHACRRAPPAAVALLPANLQRIAWEWGRC